MTPEMRAQKILEELFRAAVTAADPAIVVPQALPARPAGRTLVIGAGKAAAGMAAAVEAHWPGPLEGLVITRYGHGAQGRCCESIEIVEAAHPVPDEAGRRATDRMCTLLSGLTEDDLVLALISGGGSALLSKPLDGITFEDKRDITQKLLVSGATIAEMNVVRQHLSAVKGGRLAALAAPARVVTLIISDVPGDAPEIVASGPTVPTSATPADALAILERFGIDVPQHVLTVLQSETARTPAPDAPCFAKNRVSVVASARQSLQAAQKAAADFGLPAVILSDRIEGESRDVAQVLAALAHEVAAEGAPFAPPVILLTGGETSVTVRGSGRGGRNTEFALSAALALHQTAGIYGLAADTDGIDGTEDNAGAFFSGDTCERMRTAGISPLAYLRTNDAYSAFKEIGKLFVTGPTGTNVNDFRAFFVSGQGV